MNARQSEAGHLETLVAVAIAVGMLKGHAAPAAEPAKPVVVERHEQPAPKHQVRHRDNPSLGF
jgi:hypothetical protein